MTDSPETRPVGEPETPKADQGGAGSAWDDLLIGFTGNPKAKIDDRGRLKMPAEFKTFIEKKYGKPIEHWMKELKKVSKLAHMEQVAHLKEKFEMGHGHANAIVHVFRQKNGL